MKKIIKTSRVPRFTNQNQRRNFNSRFKRKVKNFYDKIENFSQPQDFSQEEDFSQPQVPDVITNYINNITVFHTFQPLNILAHIPPIPLIARSKRLINIGAAHTIKFDNEVQYILTHSIN